MDLNNKNIPKIVNTVVKKWEEMQVLWYRWYNMTEQDVLQKKHKMNLLMKKTKSDHKV